MFRTARHYLALLALVAPIVAVTAPLPAAAQSGRIDGYIGDAYGHAVPGATIELVSHETGQRRSTTSNDEGGYALNNVAPGDYLITVTHPGFPRSQRSVRLSAAHAQVDFTLAPNGLMEVE